MAVQPIRLFGDPVLRTPAEPVLEFDKELRTLVALSGSDGLARCVQHETDHLDGILFLDRLDAETRTRALAEIRDAPWAGTGVRLSPHPTFGRAL